VTDDELVPTAERRATARRLRQLHQPFRTEPLCRWCLHPWPCRTERWSSLILLRAEQLFTDTARSCHHQRRRPNMPIGAVVGRLTDAKNKLVQATHRRHSRRDDHRPGPAGGRQRARRRGGQGAARRARRPPQGDRGRDQRYRRPVPGSRCGHHPGTRRRRCEAMTLPAPHMPPTLTPPRRTPACEQPTRSRRRATWSVTPSDAKRPGPSYSALSTPRKNRSSAG